MHRVMFYIGPLAVYSYGVSIAAAFCLSAALLWRDSKRFGVPFDYVLDCLLWLLVGGLIGGRLLYVVLNFSYYAGHPLEILALRDGGMAFQGGMAASLLAVLACCRKRKISFGRLADLIVPYAALGQSIGRIGCFMNGCCYGKVLRKGWGVMFPGEMCMRFPVQLYSSAGLALIFLILIYIREKKYFNGAVLMSYLLMYSFFRFFVEYMRGDNSVIFAGMTMPQFISFAVFVSSAVIFAIMAVKHNNGKTRV